MKVTHIQDADCEKLSGGNGGKGGPTTTTNYYRYAYTNNSRYANNATQNVNSFNAHGKFASVATLIGYQAGKTVTFGYPS